MDKIKVKNTSSSKRVLGFSKQQRESERDNFVNTIEKCCLNDKKKNRKYKIKVRDYV